MAHSHSRNETTVVGAVESKVTKRQVSMAWGTVYM
jgi:hypothetical protein